MHRLRDGELGLQLVVRSAGTSRAAIEKLHAEVVRILSTPDIRGTTRNEGATVIARHA